MEIFAKWLLFASINLAATMSPGPAFAMTIRNAVVHNRRAALLTSLGLGLGVGGMVTFILCGFALVLTQSVFLYTIFRYIGAAYLMYLGARALFSKKHLKSEDNVTLVLNEKYISDWGALRLGFMTNILNPKGVIFFSAIYTQFVDPHTPWQILIVYGLTSMIIETVWFSGVSLILTNPKIKQCFMGFAHWIERVCGGLLIALGLRLALSKG